MSEANKPAFPVAEDHRIADEFEWTGGITKREHYAAKAMQAYCAIVHISEQDVHEIADCSFRQADAMLSETERYNDMLALVERVADMPPSVGKVELIDLADEARRILGRSE